ncbi:MAG: fatty acyl-AMP ligase [candidate division NC10 bacterium]|nr:fatty acyl-AMP ligase [candidate division NC10 bacterium]MDE2322416.1 fatty acyl-AMP ligase [candidate division NC10 bacterium]
MVTGPTPTENTLPLRVTGFSTLAEALDYAAGGETGCNFYGDRGELYAVLPYADLREQARLLARRLMSLRLERGARVAIVADTGPDFQRFFFACQYAGLVPVPLSASLLISGRKRYVTQLRALLANCRPSVAMAPPEFFPFLSEAADGLELDHIGTAESFDRLPEALGELESLRPAEMAYLQYTSGSTRFPRGVMISQTAVLANLEGILTQGLKIRPGDRAVSWLPFYHDMGLVGFVLAPMVCQVSVDYLKTQSFAMRPRLWLSLMTQAKATISFSPSFGYEMCARRLRRDEASRFDLSAWRAAGVGAETIRPGVLKEFAEVLAPSGFKSSAFVACYGMAEASLAVSFAPTDKGIAIDQVDQTLLSKCGVASPLNGCEFRSDSDKINISRFVNCGAPLSGIQVEVRGEQGHVLPERHAGVIFVRGANMTSGYFGDPEKTRKVLSSDGWLDTGDLGYLVKGSLVIIGRKKDVIIVHGRNIWPQDLEHLAEELPEVRPGDACAFSVEAPDRTEMAVMVVHCRELDAAKQADFIRRLQGVIREYFALDCFVELVPPRTLPRTSSGKLSRSKTREEFLARNNVVQFFHSRNGSAETRLQQPRRQADPCGTLLR